MNALEKILEEIDGLNEPYHAGYICRYDVENIINLYMDEVDKSGLISCSEKLPEDCEEMVLVQVSGKPADNIIFDNGFELATYVKEEGWILENYPEWRNPNVVAWMPLPEQYTPKEGE